MGRRGRVAAAALALWASLACASTPTGASLAPAQPATQTLPRGAWLAPVRITDPRAKEVEELQRALGPAIAEYVRDASYFSRVNALPGNPRPDEVVLHFDFDRYELHRRPHPAYFPAAIATLTLYIWFGGPVYRDTADISASLRVDDPAGKQLLVIST